MKLTKYFKKKKYLVQLILTIAGFLCVPLILSQVLIMERSTQGYANLNDQSVREKLYSNLSYFTDDMKDLSYTAVKASQDKVLRAVLNDTANEYDIYLAAKRISEYSEDSWSAGIWFHETGKVLYNNVNLSLKQFCDRIAGENEACLETLLQFFRETDSLKVFSTVNYSGVASDVLIIAKQVSFRSAREKDATVFFVSKHDEIEKDFLEVFRGNAGVAIISPENSFLVQSKTFSEELYSDAVFQSFLAEDSQTDCNVFIDGKNAKIYKYKDAISGYSCLVSIFEDDMGIHLRQHVSNIQLIVTISSVLIIVLLSLTVAINYKPIKNMTQKYSDNADADAISEMEILDSAFHSVNQEMLNQRHQLIGFVLSDLLRGKTVTEKDLQDFFSEKYQWFSNVIALSGTPINSAQANAITQEIKEKHECDIYITSITYRPQILVICISKNHFNLVSLQENIAQILFEITGKQYHAACGKVVDSISDIRASYLNALNVLHEGEASEWQTASGVTGAIQSFKENLLTGDVASTLSSLDVVEACLTSVNATPEIKKYYCYKLLTVYFSNTEYSRKFQEEMNRLVTFTDVKQLFTMLNQSIRRLSQTFDEDEQEAANQLKEKLIRYVDANFHDLDFSLHAVADYLGTTYYIASRLFNEMIGKHFKEYITDKRLERARMLLATTKYPIKEISAMSGFEDRTYFSRLFKEKYKLTPSQYREGNNRTDESQ